ncbi:peptide deformylase [Agreia sp. PsM10]|jgi:peptide deformylase|uniref:peptide deformylase n=1 Tax=Agreia sp. PsM10 TaxID=3030533 RepID=UPI00263B4217|nr:peptide deformylase [Agreia sp. PsM10]MDN4639773.1 peptide deformylase [Agreia sp. PsM10]
MAVLPIRISGDPVLHSPAAEVTSFDDSLRQLVSDMFETMDAAPGVGLAAPQVGVPLRLFTFGWTDDDDVEHRGVAINPVLLISPPPVVESDEDSDAEGCLSFPGERFPLVRSADALLRAVDLDQKPFEISASGWLARIFQHEFDHLNGILYVDRLEFIYGRRAAKVARKKGWTSPGSSWLPGVDDLDA